MNTSSASSNHSATITGLAIGLILTTALIHLIQAPQDLSENTVRGILFIANGLLGLIAAVGIYRGKKVWGWLLGLVVAGGALVFFIVSRSVGLPGWEDSIGEWFEPIGILALIVEFGFVISALPELMRTRQTVSVTKRVPANIDLPAQSSEQMSR